jgi:hypothetical protein
MKFTRISGQGMNKRETEHKEAEFIFEQWAKFLCLNIVDHDILHDFGDTSETVSNITSEKLRCIFSEAYRFALLQVQQRSRRNLFDKNGNELSLESFIEAQDQFINEKITDSFLLNRLEGRFTMSRTLAEKFEDSKYRDYLNW